MAREGTEGIELLKRYYEKNGSQLVIVYGQKHAKIMKQVRAFADGKTSAFYRARSCSEREQLFIWGKECGEKGAGLPEYPQYTELFAFLTEQQTGKAVIIIEEFQHFVKQSGDFIPSLLRFLHCSRQPVIAVLCSTAVGWIENSMVCKIGQAACGIAGFIKIKEQRFFELVRAFPGSTRQEQIETYAVLGGFPGLWDHFEKGLPPRENICRYLLHDGAFLHEEALRLVAGELRETGVYHTILAALATGRQKLNDLFRHTGFSRAKISVYLKNLMELEIVEKVFSYDTEGRENAQKGVYRIRNHFVAFYFHYLYPHLSRLDEMSPEDFYDCYIAPDFRSYVTPFFRQVCQEYMEYLNDRRKLPFFCTRMGEWVGKAGTIDLIAQDDSGHTIVCLCGWEKPVMPYEDYEWLLFCTRKARLQADYVYLFSAVCFDGALQREAQQNGSLRLISLDSF